MKNSFDKLNSVIKSTSTMHDNHVVWTLTIKVYAKKEATRFNIYFSLREIYNNKTKSENTMISCMR